ncbi:ABC transporter C-terminal domain-containing protein [Dictyobacter formicarum]|uniref:ABC transporter C-terminal domain-containing protein n=1 Tax=Dictyobacter formicarum TaxID=2778368 RepID=UPI00402B0F71
MWAIEGKVLYPYQGNYTEYRTRHQQIVLSTSSNKTPVKAAPAKAAASGKTSGKKNGKVKTRTLEDVEKDVEKAEAQVKSLEDALSQAALEADAEKLTQLSSDYEQARARVDELLKEWEQLADMAS